MYVSPSAEQGSSVGGLVLPRVFAVLSGPLVDPIAPEIT